MTTFSFSALRGGGRAAARPGPVTLAIRSVRPNEVPSWEVRQAQIDAEERAALRALRKRIKAQIEEDQDRIDRCLNVLDLLDGDVDLEDDERERDAGDEPEECVEAEELLGWAANVGQINLGPNTADGDATALETFGRGFRRSGHEDDEESHDRERDEAESGIGDEDGFLEQCGFTRHSYAGAA